MRRLFLGLVLAACSDSATRERNVSGESHWLDACESDEVCGGLSCICGVCTVPCDQAQACAELGGTCGPNSCAEQACLPESADAGPDAQGPPPDVSVADAAILDSALLDAALLDAAQFDAAPSDSAAPDGAVPDAAEPDAAADVEPPDVGETCDVFADVGDPAPLCQIPMDSPFACLHLARCLCDQAMGLEQGVEACAISQITPRGAITLSDFCFAEGVTMDSVIERAPDAVFLGERVDLRSSASCQGLLAIAEPARARAMQVCAFPEQDDPHQVSDVQLNDGELSLTIRADGLCERDWVQPCWTGSFEPASAATIIVRYMRFGGECDRQESRRVSAPAFALHAAHDYYNPGVRGPLTLRIRPWVRPPETACARWMVDEPCTEDLCEWTDERCVTPVIERQLPR